MSTERRKRWYLIQPGPCGSVITEQRWKRKKGPSLAELQAAVGGLVQLVKLDGRTELWVNEEGKLLDLPLNPPATRIWELYFGATDFVCGPVLVALWPKTRLNAVVQRALELGLKLQAAPTN